MRCGTIVWKGEISVFDGRSAATYRGNICWRIIPNVRWYRESTSADYRQFERWHHQAAISFRKVKNYNITIYYSIYGHSLYEIKNNDSWPASIVSSHVSVCGKTVTFDGHHGLSCHFGSGRHSRHNQVNDLLCRAFISRDTLATRGPHPLCTRDNKWSDGMTQVPRKRGRCLAGMLPV